MQYILMSRNKLYNKVLQGVINSLISAFYIIGPILPRQFLRMCAVLTIIPLYCFWGKYRRAVISNYRVILGESTSILKLNFMVLSLYSNFACYFVDLFYFRNQGKNDISEYIENISGVPDFEKTLAYGKGAVLLTAHLGNWELGGYILGQKELHINIVYYPDRFKKLEILRSQSREEMNVKEINVGTGLFTGLPIIRALRSNEIVAMQGDRDFRNDGMEVTFCNRQVSFPTGPVMCAMVAGSPIIPVFILSAPGGKYRINSLEPLFCDGKIKEPEDIRRNLQKVAAIIENMVKQYPEQWYCFYPFFQRDKIQSICNEIS